MGTSPSSSMYGSSFDGDSMFGSNTMFGFNGDDPFGVDSKFDTGKLLGTDLSRSGRDVTPKYERTDSDYTMCNKAIFNEHQVYEAMQKGEATYGDYLEACAFRNAENKRYHGRF